MEFHSFFLLSKSLNKTHHFFFFLTTSSSSIINYNYPHYKNRTKSKKTNTSHAQKKNYYFQDCTYHTSKKKKKKTDGSGIKLKGFFFKYYLLKLKTVRTSFSFLSLIIVITKIIFFESKFDLSWKKNTTHATSITTRYNAKKKKEIGKNK